MLHLGADLHLLLLALDALGDAEAGDLALGSAEVLRVERVHNVEQEGAAGGGGLGGQVLLVDGVVLDLGAGALHRDVLAVADLDGAYLGHVERDLRALQQLAHELEAATVWGRQVQLG